MPSPEPVINSSGVKYWPVGNLTVFSITSETLIVKGSETSEVRILVFFMIRYKFDVANAITKRIVA